MKLGEAKDYFEEVTGTVSATKAEVLDHLSRNPKIRQHLPLGFCFSYRKASHWLMVAEATRAVQLEYKAKNIWSP